MAVKSIIQNVSGVFNYGAIVGNNPYNFSRQNLNPAVSSGGLSVFNDREIYNRGDFNLGSGRFVDQNGVMLYNAETAGSGVLESLLMVNRGNSTFYFGVNSDSMDISRGTPIASGESFAVEDGSVRKFWAICQAGQSTVVSAEGPYRYNNNAV